MLAHLGLDIAVHDMSTDEPHGARVMGPEAIARSKESRGKVHHIHPFKFLRRLGHPGKTHNHKDKILSNRAIISDNGKNSVKFLMNSGFILIL